jgi:hypothetical protein
LASYTAWRGAKRRRIARRFAHHLALRDFHQGLRLGHHWWWARKPGGSFERIGRRICLAARLEICMYAWK